MCLADDATHAWLMKHLPLLPFKPCCCQNRIASPLLTMPLLLHLGMQNDASKNEANKDMLRLKKQVDYWKEQAGLSPEVGDLALVWIRVVLHC